MIQATDKIETSALRRQVAAQRLQEEGLDALLAVASGFHSFLEPNLAFVLSDFKAIGDAAVIVRRDGSSTLIVTPGWDIERAAGGSTTDQTLAGDDLIDCIADCLSRDGINPSSMATDGIGLLGHAMSARLEDLLAGKAKPLDNLIRSLARCRSETEIARAEKATWIAERGYERLLEIARPGMREFELAADIYCHMKEIGGDDNFLLMSASQHNLGVRAAGERMLEKGDIILAEITPSFEGQFAQLCRTVVIGEKPDGYDETYAILQRAMQAGQAAAVPGVRMSEVAEIINGPFRDAGYGDYCRPPYMRVRGHGLGLTSNLPGDVAVTNDIELEEGMVFVMHPNQYLPETGYLMCGEPVVITPDGARALSSSRAEPDAVPI
ncbi:MAG: aminopeptidase P family protein [Rhodospirillaceae bacterium]|nr:aminopeptidase P family protein [Rhodospirillaceae bacterium]